MIKFIFHVEIYRLTLMVLFPMGSTLEPPEERDRVLVLLTTSIASTDIYEII